jgi:hypothetical protein
MISLSISDIAGSVRSLRPFFARAAPSRYFHFFINALIAGQSFSVVSGSGSPVTVANGSVGAGAAGASLTYQESVSFTNGGIFGLVLLSSDALGKGFDSASFETC